MKFIACLQLKRGSCCLLHCVIRAYVLLLLVYLTAAEAEENVAPSVNVQESAPAAAPIVPNNSNDNANIISNGGGVLVNSDAATVIATTTTQTPTDRGTPEYQLRHCFYAEPELCNATPMVVDAQNASQASAANVWSVSSRDVNKCQCRAHPTAINSWYCCNITHMSMISSCNNISNWTNLHVRNATMPELDLSNAIYQTLHSLAFTDGNISDVTKSLSRVSAIKCLNMSNNNLWNISMRALSSVPNLKFLDLKKNNLSRIPKWNQNQNITVDVRDNAVMMCEALLEAIVSDSFKFVEPDQSFCVVNNTFSWFLSTDSVSIRQVELIKRFQTECPVIPDIGNCTCASGQMVSMGDQAHPTTVLFGSVDCSNLGLTELPPKLPVNTFSLNVSNNKISSIGKHFHSNPTYQNIAKFYADNNSIASMNELEGTKFMDQFQRLSLRNNALHKVPEYLLTNAFNSVVGRLVYLAGNKLQCDCISAKVFKLWLLERSKDIPDYNEILCRNLPSRVMELQEMKMCQSPQDWTDYIYYLIAIEVILLLALITKVSYDYWVFKTSGYLPWPASKMPKLPCDWLCES